jgi:hypothetical protein
VSYPPLPPLPPQDPTPPYGQPYSGQPYSGAPYSPGAPPPPQHVQHSISYQAPVTDKSKRFLNMSGGVLMVVITLIILLCCVGPIALCFFGGIFGNTAGSRPDPTVTITSCDATGGGNARIGFTIKNNGSRSESFVVKFEVKNAAGVRVGSGTDYVSSLAAGQTASEETLVLVDGSGGKTCTVVSAS